MDFEIYQDTDVDYQRYDHRCYRRLNDSSSTAVSGEI